MPKSSNHKLCVTELQEPYFFFFLKAQWLHTPVDSVHAPAMDTGQAGLKTPIAQFI